MAYPGKKISQLTETASINDSSLIPVVVTPGVSTETNKITIANAKAVLKGDTGATGAAGDDAYVYIAYASDASGTGFTMTFNASLDYIAVKNSTTAIVSPAVGDFTGLWKKYKGETGADSTVPGPQGIQGIQGNAGTNGTNGTNGTDGVDGANAYVYIAYASDNTGTGFTLTFDPLLDYIAVKNSTVAIPSPVVTDFTGLWKNYKGAKGDMGAGDVSKVGTPVDNQVGVWTGDGTLEGTANMTFDSATGTLSLTNPSTGLGSIVLDNGDVGTGVKLQSANSPGSGVLTVPNVTSTIATTDNLDSYVPKSLYDANSILIATTDNTPTALTVGASTVVGRKSTGDIVALTATESRTILNVADGATANTKAIGSEVDTGTDDAKFVTAKSINDSHNVPLVAPGTNGNLMTSNGTDWTSAAPPVSVSVTTKGDLQTFSTVPARLPVGTDGYVLESRASETTGLKWIAPPSSDSVTITAAPASDHLASGIKIALTATANVAFGDVCYIASTGKATLVDADAIASGIGLVMCADATINADASGNWLLYGVARDDTWAWTVGGLVYITVTATTGNTLSQTAPTGVNDVVMPVGVALSADIMLFKPSLDAIERT